MSNNCHSSLCSSIYSFVTIFYFTLILSSVIISIATNEAIKTSIGTTFVEPSKPVSNSYSLNCLFPTTPIVSDIEGSEAIHSLNSNNNNNNNSTIVARKQSTSSTSSQLSLTTPVDSSKLFQEGSCQWNFSGFIYSILPDSTLSEFALYASPSNLMTSRTNHQEIQLHLLASMSTPWINGTSIITETCKLVIEYRISNSFDPFEIVLESTSKPDSTIITDMRSSNLGDSEWSIKTIPLFKSQPSGQFRLIIELAKLRPHNLNELNVTYAAIRSVEFVHCFNSERKSIDGDRCYYECQRDVSLIGTPDANWFKVNATQCIDRNQMCNLITDCPNGEDESYNCNLIPKSAKSTFNNCQLSDHGDICGWINCKFNHGTYREINYKSNDGNRWILNNNNSGVNFIEAQFTSTANKYSDLAIIKSPTYNSIPFYHSNDSSLFFNSCQLTFKYLITKKSVSLAVKFVSPKLTLEESTHQSLLLSNMEKSIGPFKHPFKLSPHIWELFSIFNGYSKSKTSHKSNFGSDSSNLDHQSSSSSPTLGHRWSHVTVPLPMFVHSKYFIVIEANSGYSSGKENLLKSPSTFDSLIAVTNITLSKECFAIDVPTSEGIIHPYVKSYTILYLILGGIIFILLIISIVTLIYLYQSNKFPNQRSNYTTGSSEINELRSVGHGQIGGPGSTSTVTSRYAVNATYYACNSASPITDLTHISHDQVICERKLGNGAFGEVFAGKLKFDLGGDLKAGFPVAIKTLHEHSDSYQAEMDFTIEAQIMSKFTHRNIVRFIGVCFDAMPRMIILEFLEGKDVKEFLRKSRGTSSKPCLLNMGDLLVMALDVARGCEYLEQKHFIHRDIAARNCLLNRRHKLPASISNTNGVFNINNYDNGFNGSGLITKIADFGMARDIYRADYYKKGGKAMIPVKWMPPECFLEGIFTSKTDVWAYGVFLWEVFSMGFMPYPGHSNHEVMELVQRNERMKPPNSSTPGPVYALMLRCWQAVPDMRPSFNDIIRSIGLCLSDPDILKMPLPVFSVSGTGYCFDDQAIMRPPPDSTDYLVPSQTCSNSASNYSMSTEKTELLSPDSCSISQAEEGRLVELDESIGGITVMNSRAPPPLPFEVTSAGGGNISSTAATNNCIIPTTVTTGTIRTNDTNGQVILNTNLVQPTKSSNMGNLIIDTTTTRPNNTNPLVPSSSITANTSMTSASACRNINIPNLASPASGSSSSTTPIPTPTPAAAKTSMSSVIHNKNASPIDQLNATSLLSQASSSSFINNQSINSSNECNVNTTSNVKSNSSRNNSPNRYVNV